MKVKLICYAFPNLGLDFICGKLISFTLDKHELCRRRPGTCINKVNQFSFHADIVLVYMSDISNLSIYSLNVLCKMSVLPNTYEETTPECAKAAEGFWEVRH